MRRTVSVIIEEEKTIEKYLRENLGFTRHQISTLKFRDNGILVDGQQRRVNFLLKKGACLELSVEEEEKKSDQIVPWDGEPKVLYEDEDVLVLDKPSGILVHPSGVHYGDTLTNQAAAYFAQKGENVVLRPVGRLDKETSGAVLFAKNKMAAARLSKDKTKGGFEKEYLALVHGIPKEKAGRICAPIGRAVSEKDPAFLGTDRLRPLRMRVDEQRGSSARTDYQVMANFGDCSLLKVQIATGRTHQIRVHMAYLGHPLLGDCLYGKKSRGEEDPETGNDKEAASYGFCRAALHAWHLTYEQPFTGEKIQIWAPLPKDFEAFFAEQKGKDYAFDNTLLH